VHKNVKGKKTPANQ